MPNREPSDTRRRQIAEAALAVIAEDGLARFTSMAIARKVGVTDGALFRHFADKDAIVLAAIDRVEEILFEPASPSGADPEDPIQRLGAFFERRVAVIRENPGVARLVTSDQLAQAAPPEGVARVRALRRRSVAVVRSCLEEAAERGALAPGLEPAEATVVVVGALFALAHLDREVARPAEPGRVWRALEAFLRGPTRRSTRAPALISTRAPARTPHDRPRALRGADARGSERRRPKPRSM